MVRAKRKNMIVPRTWLPSRCKAEEMPIKPATAAPYSAGSASYICAVTDAFMLDKRSTVQ